MSAAKKRKGAEKPPPAPPEEKQVTEEAPDLGESSQLSSIERASFLEAQQNYGNPLQSTAVGDDLIFPEEGGGESAPQTEKTAATKQPGAAVQSKKSRMRGKDGATVEEKKKKSRMSGKGGAIVEEEKTKSTNVGRKAGPLARPAKNEGLKKRKKRSQSQEASDPDPIPSSDEEVTDADTSWSPNRWVNRTDILSGFRKSASDTSPRKKSTHRKSSAEASGSAEPEEPIRGQQRKKRSGHQGGTQLEVVLDAFLDFCEQYSDSVESPAVRQAIATFSSSVEEQLTEQITASKNLRVLRNDNAKRGSLIRRKRQRLLDAKTELNSAERNLQSLQKEEARLELRLADLRRGRSFLHAIRENNGGYLEHRRTHPKEKEEYGTSSLPALLLETKHVLEAEHQLRGINNRLERSLDKTEK